ncbi:MAG TPA: hypothetical protein VHQ47_00640 [Phycisphaerae bacterium]|jgi:hypothetical protein|nr:hypothetical protein [Phycisphaerae bacterium]
MLDIATVIVMILLLALLGVGIFLMVLDISYWKRRPARGFDIDNTRDRSP